MYILNEATEPKERKMSYISRSTACVEHCRSRHRFFLIDITDANTYNYMYFFLLFICCWGNILALYLLRMAWRCSRCACVCVVSFALSHRNEIYNFFSFVCSFHQHHLKNKKKTAAHTTSHDRATDRPTKKKNAIKYISEAQKKKHTLNAKMKHERKKKLARLCELIILPWAFSAHIQIA